MASDFASIRWAVSISTLLAMGLCLAEGTYYSNQPKQKAVTPKATTKVSVDRTLNRPRDLTSVKILEKRQESKDEEFDIEHAIVGNEHKASKHQYWVDQQTSNRVLCVYHDLPDCKMNAGSRLLNTLSPIPRGTLTSDLGINEKIYEGAVFNDVFYNFSVQSNEKGSLTTYSKNVYELHVLMGKANASAMNIEEYTKWNSVTDALVQTFKSERGVVVYSTKPSNPGWYLCGWVDLKSTFVKADGLFRMCATLKSIGMDAITRDPIPLFDSGEQLLSPLLSSWGSYKRLLSHVKAHQARQGPKQWEKITRTAKTLKTTEPAQMSFGSDPVPKGSVKQRASGRTVTTVPLSDFSNTNCKSSLFTFFSLYYLFVVFYNLLIPPFWNSPRAEKKNQWHAWKCVH